MAPSENQSQQLADDLAQSLKSTTSLVEVLLSEIRGNAGTLGTLEAKLQALHDNVQSISSIIRDDNGSGSIVTRLALTENDLSDLEDTVKELNASTVDLYNRAEAKLDAKANELHDRISRVKDIISNNAAEDKTEKKYRMEKTVGALKLAAQIIPGVFALGVVLVKYFFNIE